MRTQTQEAGSDIILQQPGVDRELPVPAVAAV